MTHNDMTHNELLKPLCEILEHTQELVRLAHAQEWEAMDIAVSEYQQYVTILDDQIYLQKINNAQLAGEAKIIIAQIQRVNNDLDIETSLQREKVASELRQINQSGKALEAYGR